MSASAPPPVKSIIGYDPWTFPQLVNPSGDLSSVLFGWAYYEAAECFSILIGARKRWRSPVFMGILVSMVFSLMFGIGVHVGFSASPKVTGDLFKGPAEYWLGIFVVVGGIIQRLSYFYATMIITLGVFPTDVQVRTMLYAVTAMAVVGSFFSSVISCRYLHLCYEMYLLYNETGDPMTVIRQAVATVPPFLKKYYAVGALVDTTSLLVFIILTKVSFLWKIYKSLNVGFRKSLWSIFSTRSSQRLVSCVIVGFVEAGLRYGGISQLGTVAMSFSKMYQVNSLAIMAFEDAAAIIKEHSTGSRLPSAPTKSRTTSVVEGNGTLPRKKLMRSEPV